MRMLAILLLSLSFVQISFAADKRADKRSAPAKAKKLNTKFGSDIPISNDHMIEIKSYDTKSKSYEVVAVQFPGEGSTFVTPEGLSRSIKSIDLSRIKRLPTSIVGQQFKTDKALPGLTEDELKQRAVPN